MLDEIPVAAIDLSLMPETILRRLFDAFRLEIYYDKATKTATYKVAITRDALGAIRYAAGAALAVERNEEAPPVEMPCVVCPRRDAAQMGIEALISWLVRN
ncbi:hypothetical protein [Nonomuraea typhae]|uniref:Uncharacterized protein n=1 Tax=Nonomuraea typhae TaxID=2603600 RepID=A0ABW7YXK3_9ACTN